MDLKGTLTQRGTYLRAAALIGATPLVFTRFVAGSGATDAAASVLAAERQPLEAGKPFYNGEGGILPALLVAACAEAAYTLKEVGVYVQDGTGESLYAVYRLTQPLDIAPESALTIRFELADVLSNDLEVSVSPADTVRREELGVPGGVATLDADGIVPVGQMPYTCGTEDLEAGVSPLDDGKLHFVYE